MQNAYLPLEPFCSSAYDTISTDDWLAKLRENKTMTAMWVNLGPEEYEEGTQHQITLEDVVLLDEDLKKEYEQQKPTTGNSKE